jgi:hypothetical protein
MGNSQQPQTNTQPRLRPPPPRVHGPHREKHLVKPDGYHSERKVPSQDPIPPDVESSNRFGSR